MTWREIFEGLASLPSALKHLRQLQTIGSVKVATIGPDDVIVIETDGKLSPEGRDLIKKNAQLMWPGVKVVVLDSGFHMSVVKGSNTELTH